MARCLAVAMSQAPGLSGTPDSGQCSSAATRASCAKSSATPTSRTMRARPAMSLGDSIRQTASMARCESVDIATDHIMVGGRGARFARTEDPTSAAKAVFWFTLYCSAEALLHPKAAELRSWTAGGGRPHVEPTAVSFGKL